MKESQFPIISVKYKIPSLRKNYVLRRNLLQKLDEMNQNKLTIIKAGAGSGKTTLLSMYIKERSISQVKWLTLDGSLNRTLLFWRYILETLKEYLGGEYKGLKNSFDANMQRDVLEQMIPMLADAVSLSEDIYLILDDFQNIQDIYLLQTLDIFIANMPSFLHLVLLTREIPKLNIGNLYMQGELLLVEEEEMRLSDEECREFLINTLHIDMKTDEVEEIVHKANGWIGGAQLMAIAGESYGKGSISYTSGKEKVTFDYIEKEIFSVLTKEEQLFLIKTAVPSYFNETFCKEYIPEYNFLHMMQLILDKNLFVINIDEEKKEYRYHAILQEFLLYRLENEHDMKVEFYEKAADIFFASHDEEECIRLLFEIKDYRKLMRILIQMPQNVVTFSYMMQVPMEEIIYNTNFAYQYFFCFYASLEIEECEKIYNFIREHFQHDDTFAAFQHADMFFDINWEFKKIKILSLQQIEKLPLNMVTRAYLLIKEAYFLFISDEMENALLYLDHAEDVYRKTKNIYIETFILAERTQILEEYGELNRSLELYDYMKNIIIDVPTLRASYYIGIAGVHIKQKKMMEAKEELDMVPKIMPAHNDSIHSAYLYTLAEWYYITENVEETKNIILSLAKDELYHTVFFSAKLLRYPIYRKKNAVLQQAFIDNYDRTENLMTNMDMEMIYAQIIYEQGNIEEAINIVNTLLAKARKLGNKLKVVEASVLKSRFLSEWKDEKNFINLFIEAVSYAYPENLAIPFWYEKDYICKLLEQNSEKISRLLSPKQLQFVTSAICEWGSISFNHEIGQKSDIDEKQKDHKLSILSMREWEVLEEISKGFTNKEIAGHLCISLATVKTHIINIYGKLNINNRVAAAEWMNLHR